MPFSITSSINLRAPAPGTPDSAQGPVEQARPASSKASREAPGIGPSTLAKRFGGAKMAPRGAALALPDPSAAPAICGLPPDAPAAFVQSPESVASANSPESPAPLISPREPAMPKAGRAISLARLLKRPGRPPPATIEVAKKDIFENTGMADEDRQRWTVRVTANQPELTGRKPHAQKDVILERMVLTAYSTLHEGARDLNDWWRAQNELRGTLDSPDAMRAHDAAVRAACDEMVTALQNRAQQATDAELTDQMARNDARFHSNLKAGGKTLVSALSIGVNGAAIPAALIVGGASLPLHIAMMAKSSASMGREIHKFAQGVEGFQEKILASDDLLRRAHAEQGRPSLVSVRSARELGAALGLPGVTKRMGAVRHQREQLEEFRARSARLDRSVRKMHGEVRKIIDFIDAERNAGRAVDAEQERRLGKQLEKLSALSEALAGHEAFYREFSARCDSYDKNIAPATEKAANGIAAASDARSIVSLAGSLREVALSLPV